MLKEKQTFYEWLLYKPRYVSQSEEEFLRGCGIPAGTDRAGTARTVRQALGEYAVPGIEPDKVLWSYTVRDDLGIYIEDSLNLIDIALDLEDATRIRLDDEKALAIGELNKRNATVKDIVTYILSIAPAPTSFPTADAPHD